MIKKLTQLKKPLLFLALLGVGSYGVLKAPEMHAAYIRHKVGSQVVKISDKEQRGGGTGFSMQMPSGKVLTISNAHVCEMEKQVDLYAFRGLERWRVEVLAKSIKADLCLLDGVPTGDGLALAEGVDIGQTIGIVGHPALMPLSLSTGQLLGYEHVVVLAGMGPCEKDEGMFKTEMSMFGQVCTEQFEAGLTTVVVLGGNSGSPVIDFWGNVVGVLFAGAGPEGANFGVIVKLEDLREFIKKY